jgi:CDP-glycerol glycerophosphotransferase
MPTLRGAPGSEFDLLRTSGFDFERADEALGRAGWHMSVKLHPVQVLTEADRRALEEAEHLDAVPSEMDLYSRVGTFDALITDFSGVYFDFLITGKPIVMAPFDIERYLERDRELYYDYDDICPDAPCRTWEEVFARLAELRASGGAPSERYSVLQRRFHRYLDACSSARVVAEIRRLLGP